MSFKDMYSWIYILLASAMIAVGRIYDERITVFDINLSIILSALYIIFSIPILASIRSVVFSRSKRLLYGFYFLIIFITPILWLYYGFPLDTKIAPGLEKYYNFILIVIPITIILIEKASAKEVYKFLHVLFILVLALSFLAIFGIQQTANESNRLSVLGGGSIIFARWLGFGVIYLFFSRRSGFFFRFIFIMLFVILMMATGSRGPIFSLFLLSIAYIFFTFNRNILKVGSFIIVLLISFPVIDSVFDISKLGNVDRIGMNFSSHGVKKKATSARVVFNARSVDLIVNHPFGVGAGNWHMMVNKQQPEHLIRHEYPHNIFLEIFSEYGLLTGIVFFLLIARVLYKGNRMSYNKDKLEHIMLYYMFLFYFLNAMVSGMLVDSRFMFLLIGLIICNKKLEYVK